MLFGYISVIDLTDKFFSVTIYNKYNIPEAQNAIHTGCYKIKRSQEDYS